MAAHTELLCSTRVHKTGRGGMHYVFRSTDRYQTGTDLVLDGSPRKGIDLRASGGYVIWWPAHGGEVIGERAAPLPAGLIEERRFRAERDMAPLPESAPAAWAGEVTKVLAALRHLSPNGYETWIRIGMAIHAASGGSDEGFAIWHDWSARGESYDGIEDCRYHWASFGRYQGRGVGLGTLFAAAMANGYVDVPTAPEVELPPIEAYADLEGDPVEALPAAEAKSIRLVTVTAGLLAEIPPRPWLYGRHYMRKMISATASTGGTGKSTVQMVEAVSMALGLDLFHPDRLPLAAGPLRVWVHNGEDPLDEIRRRLAATLKHYAVSPAELGGRLAITSGRQNRIIMAREVQGTTVAVPDTREAVLGAIREHGTDVLILDPFISTHQVNENSNPAIELVTFEWRSIAEETNTAIDFTHHFRKSNGTGEPSADDIRGASALMGSVRSARMLAPMTKEEAETARLDPKDRRRYVYEVNAKANLHPATDERRWYYLASVDLANAADPYPADSVGVAEHWQFPTLYSTLTPPMERLALSAIRDAAPEERRFNAGSKGWAGFLVARALEVDVDATGVRKDVAQLLGRWMQQGTLRKGDYYDPRQARRIPTFEGQE
jgi:hypothetical protein